MKQLLIASLLLSGFQNSFGSQHLQVPLVDEKDRYVNEAFERACDQQDKDCLQKYLGHSVENPINIPPLTKIAYPYAITTDRKVVRLLDGEDELVVDAKKYISMMNTCRAIINKAQKNKAQKNKELKREHSDLRWCSSEMVKTNYKLNPTWTNYALTYKQTTTSLTRGACTMFCVGMLEMLPTDKPYRIFSLGASAIMVGVSLIEDIDNVQFDEIE